MNIMDILSNTGDKLNHFDGDFTKNSFTQMPPQQGAADPSAGGMPPQQGAADPSAGGDVMELPITNLTIGDLVTLIQQTVGGSPAAGGEASAPVEAEKPTLEGLQSQIDAIAGALGIGSDQAPSGQDTGMMGAGAGTGVAEGAGAAPGVAPMPQQGMEVQASHTSAAQELSSILGL